MSYKQTKPYNLVLYITLPELGTLMRLGQGITTKVSQNRILGIISSAHPMATVYRDRYATFAAIQHYNEWWVAFEGWRGEQQYRGIRVKSALDILAEYLMKHHQEPDFAMEKVQPNTSWLQKIYANAEFLTVN